MHRRRTTVILVAIGLAAPAAVGYVYAKDGQAHPHGKREQVTSLDLYHALPNVGITHATGMVPPGDSSR